MEEEENKKKDSGEITRRDFLKDAGLVVGGAAIGSTALLAACGGETTTETATKTVTTTAAGPTITTTKEVLVPVPEEKTKLTVNGVEYELNVDPNWTLRYVLHDEIGLISVKDSCDGGACGSCTVIMNGRPILSCMALAIECDGATIETAEGVANTCLPLINAAARNFCSQCGYESPGLVCSCKALLDRNPNPSADDVIEAIAGNISRDGTYPQWVIATLEAAEELGG